MQAGAIIDRAAQTLIDEGGVRWPRADLLVAVADGQREAITLNSSLYTVTEPMECSQGVDQDAPAGALRVIGVHRNLGTDGTESGKSIRPVDEATLSAADPSWATPARAAKQARHWMPSASPRRFRLYPPLSGSQYVEITYSAEPPALSSESDPIAIPDAYASALAEYVVYRALSSETDEQQANKAAAHYQQFARLVGGGGE